MYVEPTSGGGGGSGGTARVAVPSVVVQDPLDQVLKAIEAWTGHEKPRSYLVHILKDRNTTCTIPSFGSLKGSDAIAGRVLREAERRGKVYVTLGVVTSMGKTDKEPGRHIVMSLVDKDGRAIPVSRYPEVTEDCCLHTDLKLDAAVKPDPAAGPVYALVLWHRSTYSRMMVHYGCGAYGLRELARRFNGDKAVASTDLPRGVSSVWSWCEDLIEHHEGSNGKKWGGHLQWPYLLAAIVVRAHYSTWNTSWEQRAPAVDLLERVNLIAQRGPELNKAIKTVRNTVNWCGANNILPQLTKALQRELRDIQLLVPSSPSATGGDNRHTTAALEVIDALDLLVTALDPSDLEALKNHAAPVVIDALLSEASNGGGGGGAEGTARVQKGLLRAIVCLKDVKDSHDLLPLVDRLHPVFMQEDELLLVAITAVGSASGWPALRQSLLRALHTENAPWKQTEAFVECLISSIPQLEPLRVAARMRFESQGRAEQSGGVALISSLMTSVRNGFLDANTLWVYEKAVRQVTSAPGFSADLEASMPLLRTSSARAAESDPKSELALLWMLSDACGALIPMVLQVARDVVGAVVLPEESSSTKEYAKITDLYLALCGASLDAACAALVDKVTSHAASSPQHPFLLQWLPSIVPINLKVSNSSSDAKGKGRATVRLLLLEQLVWCAVATSKDVLSEAKPEQVVALLWAANKVGPPSADMGELLTSSVGAMDPCTPPFADIITLLTQHVPQVLRHPVFSTILSTALTKLTPTPSPVLSYKMDLKVTYCGCALCSELKAFFESDTESKHIFKDTPPNTTSRKHILDRTLHERRTLLLTMKESGSERKLVLQKDKRIIEAYHTARDAHERRESTRTALTEVLQDARTLCSRSSPKAEIPTPGGSASGASATSSNAAAPHATSSGPSASSASASSSSSSSSTPSNNGRAESGKKNVARPQSSSASSSSSSVEKRGRAPLKTRESLVNGTAMDDDAPPAKKHCVEGGTCGNM